MSLQKRFERYLGWCVRHALDRDKPFVIAVAGSVGKSSTKTAIGIALGAGEEGTGVVASPKNYNNELGVPLTVFGVSAPGRSPFRWISLLLQATLGGLGLNRLNARVYVLEMGTDHPGDLAYLLDMAKPNISVLTAIGPEHTEFFGSVDAVALEEGTVLRVLTGSGTAVVNADDAHIANISVAPGARVITFGASEEAVCRIVSTKAVIEEDEPDASGLEIELALFGRRHHVRLHRVVGRPQAFAVAAAMGVVSALDADESAALQRLEARFDGMPGRMRLIEGIKHTWLLDDSYNSSPLAAFSALHDLANFPTAPGVKRIAALGDMLELGDLAESAHREVGEAAGKAGIDMLVACGTLAHVVAEGAKSAGMAEEKIFTFPKSPEAGLFIQERLKPGDVVLIKGSQGSRMEKITRELMAHPDRAEQMLVRQTPEWLAK